MNRGTNRYCTNRQSVTGLDRCVLATDDRRASTNTLWCQYVATLTVGVLDQSNVRAAIGIVLKTLYNALNSVFVALEVNNAIVLLVTAALMANRNTSVVVAAALARLLFKKRCVWLAFVQLRRLNSDDETASW